MKAYKLSRFGTIHVLTHTSGQRVALKTFEALTRHINRFGLVNHIEGLETLPHYHRGQIGYTSDPSPVKKVVEDILMDNGLTNPALIS